MIYQMIVEPFLLQDVAADADWSTVLQQGDSVVHLIGRTHVLRDRASDPLASYRAINVEGTQRVLEACIQAGVQRFIYLSSIKAVGEGSPNAYSETSPCNLEDAYGSTKQL